MKKQMMVAALLLCVGVAVAAPPAKSAKWQDDFSLAQSQAKKEGRPILADFTGSDWCGWCIKLDKEVFSQKAFQDYAASNLVLFVADYPRRKKLSAKTQKQNEGLQGKYQIQGFPTVLLLDAEGKVLEQTGYQPGGADAYVTSLKGLLDKSGWKPGVATNRTAQVVAPAVK
ncbi:MAG: thioredoxin family protein [Kiritimatiellia bacterium]